MNLKQEIKELETDLKSELDLKLPKVVETFHDIRQTRLRLKKIYNENDKLHSYSDAPAVIKFTRHGQIECMEWYKNGVLHRDNKPARMWFYNKKKNGIIRTELRGEEYFVNGEYHREDEPAIIFYYITGEIESMEYYTNGRMIDHPNDQYVLDRGMKKNISTKDVDEETAQKLRHTEKSMKGTDLKKMKTFKEVKELIDKYQQKDIEN